MIMHTHRLFGGQRLSDSQYRRRRRRRYR